MRHHKVQHTVFRGSNDFTQPLGHLGGGQGTPGPGSLLSLGAPPVVVSLGNTPGPVLPAGASVFSVGFASVPVGAVGCAGFDRVQL